VNTVLLRSLPFVHPDRLVKIMANNRGGHSLVHSENEFVVAICNSLVLRDSFLQDVRFVFRLLGRVNTK
jgi:hypothetical protein